MKTKYLAILLCAAFVLPGCNDSFLDRIPLEELTETQKNIPVLHQISAEFEAGKFYSIIGSSGSGKTTFLSLLAGLDLSLIHISAHDLSLRGLR